MRNRFQLAVSKCLVREKEKEKKEEDSSGERNILAKKGEGEKRGKKEM